MQCQRAEFERQSNICSVLQRIGSKDAVKWGIAGTWFAMIAVREMGHDELLRKSLKLLSYRAAPA
jgi:hypothetical protein